MTKVRRTIMAALLVATSFAVVPGIVPVAEADPGGLTCRAMAFGVKSPTPFGEASSGSGFFGAVQAPGGAAIPSTMTCTGSITGVATVSGNYTWCPNSTDHNPQTNPHPGDPTKFNCNGAAATANGDEALYPAQIPVLHDHAPEANPNVHIVATAVLEGQSTWQDPSGAPAPDCSVELEGHAIAPTKLDVVVNCGGQVYEGAVVAGFIPILGTAGDNFSHPSDSTQNPPTCAAAMGGSPDCFRALVFEGNMTVAALS